MPQSFRDLLPLALITLGVAIFGAAGLPEREPASALQDPAPSKAIVEGELLLALSGNELGFIRPCGCSKPKLGGIDRRGQLLATWRAEHPGIVALGLGNMILDAGPQARIKFEHFLLAMMAMDYKAFFPGPRELALGASYLEEQKAFAPFPMVALNVLRADGQPVFEPEFALAGTPYVLTGLVPATLGLSDLTVRPWAEALPEFFARHDPEKAKVLLAWNGDETEARALAEAVPAAWRPHTMILFGGNYDAPAKAPGEGWPVPAFSVGSKGRNLARFQPSDPKSFLGTRLEEEIGAHPDTLAILEGYRAAVQAADLLVQVPRTPAKVKYLGDQSCKECHGDIVDTLITTPHQHAWKTLVDYGDHHDPECVSCHVTGYGESTGFLSEAATQNLVNVNCEACHGPGGDHVEFGDPMPKAKPPETHCRTCHDPDNSPRFDYKVYWPKIQHPRKAK